MDVACESIKSASLYLVIIKDEDLFDSYQMLQNLDLCCIRKVRTQHVPDFSIEHFFHHAIVIKFGRSESGWKLRYRKPVFPKARRTLFAPEVFNNDGRRPVQRVGSWKGTAGVIIGSIQLFVLISWIIFEIGHFGLDFVFTTRNLVVIILWHAR